MTSESHDFQLHSIVHGVVTLQELGLDYGAERRRLCVTNDARRVDALDLTAQQTHRLAKLDFRGAEHLITHLTRR
jgi:hypothetical protein